MTLGEIERTREEFAAAAARAKAAGFDGVQVHMSHGYLLNEFLTPYTYRRTDAYGGSFTNRLRLPQEVLLAVRDRVGPDYPVLVKLNGDDLLPLKGGLSTDEFVRVALSLQERHGRGADHPVAQDRVPFPDPPASIPVAQPVDLAPLAVDHERTAEAARALEVAARDLANGARRQPEEVGAGVEVIGLEPAAVVVRPDLEDAVIADRELAVASAEPLGEPVIVGETPALVAPLACPASPVSGCVVSIGSVVSFAVPMEVRCHTRTARGSMTGAACGRDAAPTPPGISTATARRGSRWETRNGHQERQRDRDCRAEVGDRHADA